MPMYSFNSWTHITIFKRVTPRNELQQLKLYYITYRNYVVETELGFVEGPDKNDIQQ